MIGFYEDDLRFLIALCREHCAVLRIELREAHGDPAMQQNWLQAAEGLERRLGIWQLLIERGGSQPITPTPERSAKLLPVLTGVATLLADTRNGQDWRDYLLLDQIAAASSEGADCDQASLCRRRRQALIRYSRHAARVAI